jgi:hypothetical protein
MAITKLQPFNLDTTANYTFANITASNANLGNAATANFFIGSGNNLSNIQGANVSDQVANALISGTVYTNAQPNITSLGTLTGLTSTGTANFAGASNVTLGAVSNLHISGGTANYVLQTDGAGNLSWASQPAGGGAVYFQSNVDNVIAGSTLAVNVDYGNLSYPGGLFTLEQLGPVAFTATDTWVVTGATSKNAYANLIANTANVSNITLSLSLTNATFNVQSTDTITIGASTITGANITGLGISGTGGTYTIANTLVAAIIQTNSSTAVSANLTTSRGVKTTNGINLTTIAAVPFNVTSLTGSFAASSVPFWTPSQTFNWSAALTSGATVDSGNVTYSNVANSVSGSLTSIGDISGTSGSLDSTLTYTISSSDYTGAGGFGAGTRTIPSTVNGTVSPATLYYPLFYATSGNSSNPNFTTSSTSNSNNFVTGQGANTTATPSNYLWIGTPTSTARSFGFTFLGSFVSITPDVTYANQTISGQTYMVYGFTNYSAVTFIYTV